jgi:hypothetical protein
LTIAAHGSSAQQTNIIELVNHPEATLEMENHCNLSAGPEVPALQPSQIEWFKFTHNGQPITMYAWQEEYADSQGITQLLVSRITLQSA